MTCTGRDRKYGLTQSNEGDSEGRYGCRTGQEVVSRGVLGPLTVIPSVARAAHTQVAGPQVEAGAAVQARLPHTLVHVLTAAVQHLSTRTAAVMKNR